VRGLRDLRAARPALEGLASAGAVSVAPGGSYAVGQDAELSRELERIP